MDAKVEPPISDRYAAFLFVILFGVWLVLLSLDAETILVILFFVLMSVFAGLVHKLGTLLMAICGVALVVALANLFGHRILWGFFGLLFVWFLHLSVLLLTLGILSHSRPHIHRWSLKEKLGLAFLAVSSESAWFALIMSGILG